MSCGPCRLCAGAFVNNPEPPTRIGRMSNPTPDTGTLPGTALETYGKLLNGDTGRDAIHLAVKAVTTDERLFPGQHVGITSVLDGVIKVAGNAPALIGIVDPFLDGSVYPGQWFWLTLYPRTITSLRHEWTHPVFPEGEASTRPSPEAASSEEWLRRYADDLNETLTNLLAAADAWVARGDYYYGDGMIGSGYNGKFEGERTHDEFWHHYQVNKGVVVSPDDQTSFFTCAC